jgi:ribosome biogenesis GTPase
MRLAARCRFADCRHETAHACAILAAIEDGSLDPARQAMLFDLARFHAREKKPAWWASLANLFAMGWPARDIMLVGDPR